MAVKLRYEVLEKRSNDQAELITKLSQAFSQERLVRRQLAEALRASLKLATGYQETYARLLDASDTLDGKENDGTENSD